jgi:putative transposase
MLKGLILSIGTIGDALDNGLCENTIRLYKTERARGFPVPHRADRHARRSGGDDLLLGGLVKQRRLMHRLGRRPPAEAEAEYYARQVAKGADQG